MTRLLPLLIAGLLQSTPVMAECSSETKRDLANNAVVVGGLVALCGLHADGLITTTSLATYLKRDAQRIQQEPENLKMVRAAEQKFKRDFPDCPIPRMYFGP